MPKKFALRAHSRKDVSARRVAWRIFCAIELPETVRARVLRQITRLREVAPDAQASWSRDANLHLTLKFLREVPQALVVNLSNAASRAVDGFGPFAILLERTGVFPKHGPPRVLWVGVDDLEGKLAELHARLEEESVKEGFQREPRQFRPHLTLARLRKPQYAKVLAAAHEEMQFEPVEITVSELLVIRTELSSEGSNYTVISRHALFGGR